MLVRREWGRRKDKGCCGRKALKKLPALFIIHPVSQDWIIPRKTTAEINNTAEGRSRSEDQGSHKPAMLFADYDYCCRGGAIAAAMCDCGQNAAYALITATSVSSHPVNEHSSDEPIINQLVRRPNGSQQPPPLPPPPTPADDGDVHSRTRHVSSSRSLSGEGGGGN
ncbi:Uncharacterized protein FWK35_00026079 [Aphis craccivora]|uniref:Uncharacterized protein n=1 Tax=Aphis craccivora TaxID=307492 RepID=A0A6G0YV81_APHCR|nr:Uncharacterized protein FWK35_00026079 [Aphis craccivora]